MNKELSNKLKIVREVSWKKTTSSFGDLRDLEGMVENDELFCTVCKQRIGFNIEKIPFCHCQSNGDIYGETAIPGYDITKQNRIAFFKLPGETLYELKKELITEIEDCRNCKWFTLNCNDEPCRTCLEGSEDYWEKQER